MFITDNFLDGQAFNKLVDLVDPLTEGDKLHFVPSFKVTKDGSNIGNIQFVHIVSTATHSLLDESGISQELRIEAWVRAKINFSLGQEEAKISAWHTDFSIPRTTIRTGILYLNTNNGYTEFKDGTKIESVANRYIEFDSKLEHRGVSCTDNGWRAVLNLNYIPEV